MTPVFKLPCPDVVDESGDEDDDGAGEEPDFGRDVGFPGEAPGVVPEPDPDPEPEPDPVPEPVAGVGLPINAPGPISGVSGKKILWM